MHENVQSAFVNEQEWCKFRRAGISQYEYHSTSDIENYKTCFQPFEYSKVGRVEPNNLTATTLSTTPLTGHKSLSIMAMELQKSCY